MAKKQSASLNRKAPVAAPTQPQQTPAKEPQHWFNFRLQCVLIALLGFVLYANTLNHEYAFDDMMAIVDNDYVQQGASGIPRIMTSDAYQSYLESRGGGNQLAGGRYRPLSLVTFAIEQQLLGTSEPASNIQDRDGSHETKLINDMHFRHWVNVLLYISAVLIFFSLLSRLVPAKYNLVAFLSAILFIAHPIHTEVVANVKSRDEILSFLFISLTFLQYLNYNETSNRKHLFYASISFFLALLSKEYAATLVVLIPVFAYTFGKKTVSESLKSLIPFLVPLGVYLLLRFSSVSGPAEGADNNIMNNPYLYATFAQKLATEFYVLLYYVRLMLYPNPLVVDYSYRQVAYTTFADPMVWLAVALYSALIILSSKLILKRNGIGFAIAFFLGNILLVSNLFFNIGAPLGERLVFLPSVVFCTLAGLGLNEIAAKFQFRKTGFLPTGGISALVIIAYSFRTIDRNPDWKNNQTLFLHDVKYAPASVLVNNDAAAACMALAKATSDTASRVQWFNKAIGYFTTSISIYPGYSLAYLNRGLCQFNTGHPFAALKDWDSVRVQSPTQQNISKYLTISFRYFMAHAMMKLRNNDPDSAQIYLKGAIEANPDQGDGWYQLGLLCYNSGKKAEALQYLQHAQRLMPGNKEISDLLNNLHKE